jgi:hypothetical protein
LDLNFEPADHIVLTRSHHTWSIKPSPKAKSNQPAARASQRKQRWCNLCIKTCTAEVFRPASTLHHQLAPNDFRSRPARTPPSTFLFLHLNLSNNPMSQNIALPNREKFRQALHLEDRQAVFRRTPAPRRERTFRTSGGRKQPSFSE